MTEDTHSSEGDSHLYSRWKKNSSGKRTREDFLSFPSIALKPEAYSYRIFHGEMLGGGSTEGKGCDG